MENLGLIVIAFAAYLLGSIPTGYLAARAKGIDIRTVGSGNMGATNVFRILGKGPGIFVLTVDALKGWAAIWWGDYLGVVVFKLPDCHCSASNVDTSLLLAGIAAILGHNYTCWLNFKGGKGIATTAGVFLALAPTALGMALGVWLAVFAVSRYVSLASIAAAVALPASVWFKYGNGTFSWIATALGVLAIYKHKANIQRLLAGTESRGGAKKNTEPQKDAEDAKV